MYLIPPPTVSYLASARRAALDPSFGVEEERTISSQFRV